MPRKKKITSKKPTSSTQTKAEFVLAQDPKLSAPEVVALAKAAGFDITAHRIHNIRWGAKKGTGKKAKVRRMVRLAARPGRPAPRRGTTHAIAGIRALDLAYAVGRLVAEGRTTDAEVASLAAERTSRITSLETELAALKGGNVSVGERATIASKPMRTVVKSTVRTKGKVTTRVDGRKFTMTAKALSARKLQGQYLGHLRQVPDAEKATFKAIAKEKGVAVAVAELKKRLGKG